MIRCKVVNISTNTTLEAGKTKSSGFAMTVDTGFSFVCGCIITGQNYLQSSIGLTNNTWYYTITNLSNSNLTFSINCFYIIARSR